MDKDSEAQARREIRRRESEQWQKATAKIGRVKEGWTRVRAREAVGERGMGSGFIGGHPKGDTRGGNARRGRGGGSMYMYVCIHDMGRVAGIGQPRHTPAATTKQHAVHVTTAIHV